MICMLSESGTSSETRSISLECPSTLKIVTKSGKSCGQRSNLNPVVTNSTGQLMTDKDVNAIKTDSWHSLSVDQAGLICPLTGVCLITRLCIVLGHSMKRMPWPWRKVPLDSLPFAQLPVNPTTRWPFTQSRWHQRIIDWTRRESYSKTSSQLTGASESPSGRKVSGLYCYLPLSLSICLFGMVHFYRNWAVNVADYVFCVEFLLLFFPPLAKNKLKPATKTNTNLWHSLGTHLWICFEYCYNLLGQKDNINL